MRIAIQALHGHVQIGEDKGLSPLVIWIDGGEESNIHLHFACDVHGEDTSGRGVFKVGLSDRISHIGRRAHPGVRGAIDTDETSPASNLAPSRISTRV